VSSILKEKGQKAWEPRLLARASVRKRGGGGRKTGKTENASTDGAGGIVDTKPKNTRRGRKKLEKKSGRIESYEWGGGKCQEKVKCIRAK